MARGDSWGSPVVMVLCESRAIWGTLKVLNAGLNKHGDWMRPMLARFGVRVWLAGAAGVEEGEVTYCPPPVCVHEAPLQY